MERSVAVIGCSVAAVSTGVAAWALYKWCGLKHSLSIQHRCDAQREVQKQLVHHYVNIENLTHLKDLIPSSADEYHSKLATFCSDMCQKYKNTTCRILDVGSGVGGTAFALSKYYEEVVATDINAEMTIASLQMLQFSEYTAPLTSEGGKHIKMYKVRIPDGCDKTKVNFVANDVSTTLKDYGMFDCILVSNVLTELSNPREFLQSLSQHVPVLGILIIADPFLWEGGTESRLGMDGSVKTNTHLQTILDHEWSLKETTAMPFYVAQSERVAQVASAEVSVWQRIQDSQSSEDSS